ncbi:MAG TPA: flavin reductase family protein, partial [Thermoanaerobaculia bacterium]|nr:flavin reductase family protein [Thermoanaerobaculia bacterium]
MSLDARGYRDIWGNFATGVTVITTDVGGRLHGMTANGVVSVSLDPLLMIVCVDKSTRCHGQLCEAGKFGVSFLGQDQEAISSLFAQRGDPEQGQLRGIPFRAGPHGTPILDGSIAYLECRLADVLPGGDHDLFVGEALGGEILRQDAAPLLFFRGRYRQL